MLNANEIGQPMLYSRNAGAFSSEGRSTEVRLWQATAEREEI